MKFGKHFFKMLPQREDIIQFAWKFRRFNQSSLKLFSGESFIIHSTGIHNRDSGPDFLNARIQIGETIWAGNVEIHLKSSDWYRHHHELDEHYNSVILHVVYLNDAEVKDTMGNLIPVFELKSCIDEELLKKWVLLEKSQEQIPCSSMKLPNENELVLWKERLRIERLEYKSEAIRAMLMNTTHDWDETLYVLIARNMGFTVNSLPFELLAMSLPLKLVRKHFHSEHQLEALYYGQSGFLNGEMSDSFPINLQNEYRYLQKKYALKPLDASIWKFMRMRPVNFPTLRIAQFIGIVKQFDKLRHLLNNRPDLEGISKILNVETNIYWDTHFLFDKASGNQRKALGIQAINGIIINTIIPFLYYKSSYERNEKLSEYTLELLFSCQKENNRILRDWEKLGLVVKTAADSQALLHLRLHYCDHMRCMDCAIGYRILS